MAKHVMTNCDQFSQYQENFCFDLYPQGKELLSV